MPRPLFRKTTDELEQLFRECGNSPEQLRILAEELSHRERPKAVALSKKVEAAISQVGSTDAQTTPAPENSELNIPPQTETGDGQVGTSQRQSRTATTSFQDFIPPEQFTLVQPLGVRPRPSAYRPTLQNDLRLPISPGDSPTKVFRLALAELIREMKRRRVGHQQFTLEDGERLATEASGFSYQFEFGEEANIFEGAKVELVVSGRVVTGYLTGILSGRIIVTLQEDFGKSIASCILRIDNTALLQALHDRLEKIERGEVPGFRAEFAACVLKNAGAEHPTSPLAQWPWKRPPTPNQRHFVEVALANEISWLFGPPGTGKTETLSALARALYEGGKRVLICSNTNQAVDQLLQQLCRKMRETDDPALDEGRVVRLGRIEEELEKEFGDFITPERIAERKSEALMQRKSEIESELERLGREVAYAEEVLRRFLQLDDARKADAEATRQLRNAESEQEQALTALSAAQNKQTGLASELERWQQVGALRRLLMRSERTIRLDSISQQSRVTVANNALTAAKQKLSAAQNENQRAAIELAKAEKAVAGEDREQNKQRVAEYNTKRQPLREELAAIAKKLEDIRNAVLREARIVGATVTRTFLRPVEFSAFDTVIVDEASMILLPAIFQAAGLATERVVIAGDFQQLPPIVQTEQQCIHDILAHDVFAGAGISLDAATAGKIPRLVMLDEQFRMDDSICKIVSATFYQNRLQTHPDRTSPTFSESEFLSNRLTIVDTSRIWPFTTRNTFNSRLNLMHALAVRNLVLHLKEHDRLKDAKGKGRIGICTPYTAQAKLLREILKSHELDNATVRASTVHGFQGDERPVMVLDLVDSVGERNVGIFLQAERPEDAGAKLLNVALSRAQEGLIILANLTFLDQKLPSYAILRGVLHDLQRSGRIVDVKEVLALHPILEDLKQFGSQPELDPECLRTGLFGGRDFAKLCRFDMENAKKSIVVFSGFITQERAAQMGDLFRQKIAGGVKVRCVTRPPNRNGTIPEEQGRTALAALESLGVAIDLRNDIHEKVVLIDNTIAWFGSLNPLSHTPRTSELMARVDNAGVASHIASILSVRRRSAEELERGAFTEPENPRCEKCSDWGVLMRGKHGPFFSCVNYPRCNWKQNVDRPRRKRN
jgi:superfamily I DNA and/or RNA helicase